MTPSQWYMAGAASVLAVLALAWALSRLWAAIGAAWARWRAEVSDPLDVEQDWATANVTWHHRCNKVPAQGPGVSVSCEQGECCPWCGAPDPTLT